MSCLYGSQCKLKILYLPTAGYIKWYTSLEHSITSYTIYPMDSFSYNHAAWIKQTLVNGKGIYTPYAEWVIQGILLNQKIKGPYSNVIKEHFEAMYD